MSVVLWAGPSAPRGVGARFLILVVCTATLTSCGDPSGAGEDVDPTGSYFLHSVDGGLLPTSVTGSLGSALVTGGWMVLDADGTYEEGGAALLSVAGSVGWEVGRGGGTWSVAGSTVSFSDSGDGSGPFTGSWNAGRLSITILGVESEFRAGAAVAALDVSPPEAFLGSCAPLRLTGAATDPAGGAVGSASVHWSSSDVSVAIVDEAGAVTPVGSGEAVILGTVGAGVDSTIVRVDHRVPDPVTLDPVVWAGARPRLSWSPADPDAFCSYVIGRSGNWGSFQSLPGGVDSVLDASVTTWLDDEVERLFGLSISYAVAVQNGPHSALSDSVRLVLGTSLAHDIERRPLVSPTRDEIYLLTGGLADTLLAISSTTHTVIGRRLVRGGPVAVRPDGEALFVVTSQNEVDSLYTLAPGTLDALGVAAMAPGPQRIGPMIAGRPGRVYLAGTDVQTGVTRIDVVDSESGAELGQVDVSTTASASESTLLAVSPDASRLFVAKATEVVVIDVSTDTPGVVGSTTLPYVVGAMALAPDGARLHVGQRWVGTAVIDALDATTLASVQRHSAPGLFDFFVTNEHLYVSMGLDGRPGDLHCLSGDVVRLDLATLTEVDRRGYVLVPSWVAVSRDGGFVYARGPTSTTLVVPTW